MTTHYSEKKVFTSSYYVQIGRSKSRSIDGESIEFHVDPVSSKLVRDKISSVEETAPEFVTEPKRQFVNEGETAKFKASFEGSPQTVLTWSLNGKDVTKDDRHKIFTDKDYHILEIQKVATTDQGTYTCTIKNSAGSATASAELEIFVRPKPHTDKSVFLPPTVDVPLEDTEFADKEKDATLVCKFHNGFDATSKWYKDGREVGTWQAKQTFDGRTAKLVFREAAKRICGVYECIVKNTGGEAKTRGLVSLLDPKIKPEAPKFKVSLVDQSLESGEKLVLETEVTGLPRPSLKWYKDNTELGSTQDIRMEYKDGKGRLIMDNMSADDATKFTCVAQNVAGEAQTEAAVTITGSEDLREPPIFTKELHDMEVDDGDRVEMKVEVKGTPPFDIVWVHNNREIPPTDPVCRMLADGHTHTLIIPEVFPEDKGEYVCEAYNNFGDTDTFCRLIVKEKDEPKDHNTEKDEPQENREITQTPPEFIYEPAPVYVTEGDSAILRCRVAGQPLPSLHWSKDLETIIPGAKYKLSNIGTDHSLEILSTTEADSAEYTCTLCNVKGQVSATGKVNVKVKAEEIPSSGSVSVPSHRSAFSRVAKTESKDTQISSINLSLDHNQNLKLLKSSNSPKPECTPVIAKKGGVEQFDFRGVLKSTTKTNKTNLKPDNPKLKVTNDKDIKSGTDLREVLKRNVHGSENNIFIDRNKKLTEDSDKSKPRVFTETEINTKSDFRNVLKHKDNANENNVFSEKSKKLGGDVTVNKRLDTIKPVSLRLNTEAKITPEKKKQTWSEISNTKKLNRDSGHGNVLSKRQHFLEKKSINEGNVNHITAVDTKDKPDFLKVELKHTKTNDLDVKLKKKDVQGSINKQAVSNILQKFENNQASAKNDFRSVLKHRKENDLLTKDQVGSNKMEHKTRDSIHENHIGLSDTTLRTINEEMPHKSELKITDEKLIAKIEEELKNPSVLTEDSRPRKGMLKPEFKNKMENKIVPYGSEVVLECEVVGQPDPDIMWSINNKEIKKSKFFQMSYKNTIARLVIAETFSEDEGEYKCTATNSEGSAMCSCDLHVQERASSVHDTEGDSDDEITEEDSEEEVFSPTVSPPKIYDISPSKFCIIRGRPIEFRVSFSAAPQGTVKWLLNKQEIVTDSRVKVDTSEHFSTLSISDIQASDSGRINVIVENDIGLDTAYASLTVQDVPDPPVGCPSVCDVTLRSVTLSWYGPAYDGGCPITNYRVEMCDAEDQEWKLVTSNCKNTTYLIEGLTPHTPYFFRVFAENKVGLSHSCQTDDVTVTTERKPSTLTRLLSFDSDDVFAPDVNEVFSPVCEYGTVSPLSPDEIPFEHREVNTTSGRKFEDLYDCQQEVGKGKFGSVYKCVEKGTNKHWAAKILKCREADKGKVRLEIEVMNQLKHPKILMLWDAFEAPRKMILVMEYVGGGELFERVLDDSFDLTERDCVQFMRQICDAVSYMHKRNILHLDLKPENVLCVKNESNKIKIIDFGLARFYKPGESTRVLFGTPEFIAPEVVNYDEIGFKTDMWSIGVICYVLLSGLSPFMGDSDAETLANVTHGEFDFEDDSFEQISDDAKDFIDHLLVKDKRQRLTAQQSLDHPWLASDSARLKTRRINTTNLKRFMARRKWQKTGNAIRALGRMTSLQRLFKKETNIPVYDSGNGSVSSTSSVSSVDSQTTLGQGQSVTSNNDKADIAKDSSEKEISIPNSQGENTEDKRLKINNEKEMNYQNRPNSQDNSALTEVNNKDKKTDITSWRTRLYPECAVDKSSVYTKHTPKPVNQIVGKFETASNKTENAGKDSKSTAKIELTNNTPARFESTNQIKVKLKSSNETQFTNKTETASSCENQKTNELHLRGHNDSHAPESQSPHFVKEMVDSKAFPGDSVRFDVEFIGNPEPEVNWYFEEDMVLESPRHILQCVSSGTCSLIVKEVNEEDDGEYSCKIVNSVGEETCSAELIVYGAI